MRLAPKTSARYDTVPAPLPRHIVEATSPIEIEYCANCGGNLAGIWTRRRTDGSLVHGAGCPKKLRQR